MQHTVHPYFTELPLKRSGHCVIYYNNCKDAQFKQGEPMSWEAPQNLMQQSDLF